MSRSNRSIPGQKPLDYVGRNVFGQTKAPNPKGPAYSINANTPGVAGAARTLQSINRFRGGDSSPQTIASRVNNANSTLYPTNQGANAAQEYARKTYPDGNTPAAIAKALRARDQGGINDMGLSIAVSEDMRRRNPTPTRQNFGIYSQVNKEKMPTYLQGVMDYPVNRAKAQDAYALGPTGPGMFSPLLSLASFAFPALAPASIALNGGTGIATGDPLRVAASAIPSPKNLAAALRSA